MTEYAYSRNEPSISEETSMSTMFSCPSGAWVRVAMGSIVASPRRLDAVRHATFPTSSELRARVRNVEFRTGAPDSELEEVGVGGEGID
jgi:hypothetical protein